MGNSKSKQGSNSSQGDPVAVTDPKPDEAGPDVKHVEDEKSEPPKKHAPVCVV